MGQIRKARTEGRDEEAGRRGRIGGTNDAKFLETKLIFRILISASIYVIMGQISLRG
jgi:hypothetical protein